MENVMKKLAHYLIAAIALQFSVVTLFAQSYPSLAQIRGSDSQEFFDQGNQEMEQDIQQLEQQQQQEIEQKQEEQTLEQKEQQLDDTLNIEQKNTQIEDTPGPGEAQGLDDNVPEQPTDEEVQIKF